VLGNLIARGLKMKSYATKIGIVLFALTLGLGPFVARIIQGQDPRSAIELGIDLAGGTNMVFQVDHEAARAEGKEITSEVMDKMVSAVGRRVNPTGTEEVTVRKVGQDRIEVIVPGADQEKIEQIKRLIVDLGQLEFARLARQSDDPTLIELADGKAENVTEIRQDGRIVAMWRRAAIDQNTGEPKLTPGEWMHYRTVTENGKPVTEYLVVVDPDQNKRISGRHLKSVRPIVGERGLAVSFTFNDRGGYLFQQLTSKYQPREGAGKSRLAILLNNDIHSAPRSTR
jgi:SecD/SecF fusion protein